MTEKQEKKMYPQTKQLILKKMEEGFYPGVAAAFIKENQVESFTAGFAQVVPEKQPMTEDLLFDAASLTKVVATTSLVLRLLEDGKIELDQPLHKYLSEFEKRFLLVRFFIGKENAVFLHRLFCIDLFQLPDYLICVD
ncbi:serine hydrolase domain-containing protein [Listeria innocua]